MFKMSTIRTKKEQKGFTLIELMIVIAIIGILAAIAIPQFSSYRTKAFNASAISDIHTARLGNEALFGDYQQYGASVTATGTAGTAAGSVIDSLADRYISTDTAGQEIPVSISRKVSMVVNTSALFDYATVTAKHASGDKFYSAESDQSGVYQLVSSAGTVLTAGVAASNINDSTAASYNVM